MEDGGRSSDCRIECVEKLLHLLHDLSLHQSATIHLARHVATPVFLEEDGGSHSDSTIECVDKLLHPLHDLSLLGSILLFFACFIGLPPKADLFLLLGLIILLRPSFYR